MSKLHQRSAVCVVFVLVSSSIGCATQRPATTTESQEQLVEVALDSLTGRYSFRPIQRRNTAQAVTSRKSLRPR